MESSVDSYERRNTMYIYIYIYIYIHEYIHEQKTTIKLNTHITGLNKDRDILSHYDH